MFTTKMNWSGPNVIHFGRKSQFGPDHFILVETKSLWSNPNQFGQIKTILDRPKLFCPSGQGISGLKGIKSQFESAVVNQERLLYST